MARLRDAAKSSQAREGTIRNAAILDHATAPSPNQMTVMISVRMMTNAAH